MPSTKIRPRKKAPNPSNRQRLNLQQIQRPPTTRPIEPKNPPTKWTAIKTRIRNPRNPPTD